jgi:phosphate transport system substrate-binding protein
MNTKKAYIIILAAALAGCFGPKKDRITIKGSTTILPIVQRAAEKFRKLSNVTISIEANASKNGISALLNSSCDIAASSCPMTAGELEEAGKKGLMIKEIAIGYDMIIPIVNPSNPLRSLTKEQLKAVYSGQCSDWKEIGGGNGKIMVVSRDSSSGTFAVWNEKILQGLAITSGTSYEDSNGAIINAVSDNTRAIAYIARGYLNNQAKPLKVNGIAADTENGKSGKFPLTRTLYLYINESNTLKESGEFADFLLSPEGQKCVERAGYIPLTP